MNASKVSRNDNPNINKSKSKKDKKTQRLGRIKPVLIPPEAEEVLQNQWLDASELQELGVEYTKGKFSKQEDKALLNALEDYKTLNRLSDEDMHQLIYGKNGKKGPHKNFWKDIGAALGSRPLKTMTAHVQRMQNPYRNSRKWTSEDDMLLKRLVDEYGCQWKKIGDEMERTGLACRDRYRNYVEHVETKRSGKWSVEETKILYNIVDELVKEGQSPDMGISWAYVSEKMGFTRSQEQCRAKWQRDVRVRYERGDCDKAPKWTEEDNWVLINKLWNVDVEEDVDIPWEEIVDDPNWGPWTPTYVRVAWGDLRRSNFDNWHLSFSELCEKLYFEYRGKRKETADKQNSENNTERTKAPPTLKFVVDSDEEVPDVKIIKIESEEQ